MKLQSQLLLMGMIALLAAGCGAESNASTPAGISPTDQALREAIVTVLPRDAIPSIDNPRFHPVEQADRQYASEERVIGVEIDGEAKAYSVGLLSSHEIVNDMLAGRPIAVTW